MAVQRFVCLLLLAAGILPVTRASCQDVYIPPGASVHFFAKDTAAIFGNITVDGRLEQDSAHFLHFKGGSWKNAGTASFTDKGIVAFTATNTPQLIYGAYNAGSHTGSTMPVLWLNNTAGLSLENTTDLSAYELRFIQGILSLNGASMVIRNGQAAAPVTGYHENAFVATGQAVMGGFLEMQNLSAAGKTYTWPVGTIAGNYTPFAFINNGAAGSIRGRVFSNVYEGGLSGTLLNPKATGTTWMLNSTMPLTGRMTLQHFTANEGALYAASHAKAFVSRFNETAGTWNMTADHISPPVTPGVITTTAPMALAATTYMDVAAAPAGTQLFAGLVTEEQLVCQQALTVFTGERLSTLKVQLNWVVASLTNLGRMIIEKDVYNNGNWLPVDSLLPTSATAYTYTDTTAYSNTTSAYRIRMNCNIGGYVYANRILVAPPERASDPVLMYPNPASVIINVAIPDYQRYITLAVYDLTGHMLIRQQIFGPVTPVNVSALPGGSYNIFLLTPDNKVTGNLRMIKVN